MKAMLSIGTLRQRKKEKMSAKLFQYAVIYSPKTVKDQAGNETQGPPELLVEITNILAANDKEVAMRAARLIPEKYLDKLDRVEVCVRPF